MAVKRKTVKVYRNELVEDEFGGSSESLVLESVIHATMEVNFKNENTGNVGSMEGHEVWLKTHNEISDPTEKILVIDRDRYTIQYAINNRRRWFYKLDKQAGEQ